MRQKLFATAVMAAAAMGAPSLGAAELFDKPITLIVNFSAGGATDTAARLMAPKAAEVLGQDIVIKNTTGASGTLGVAETARSEADGHIIGTGNMPAFAIIPSMRSLPYDPLQDLIQIAAVLPYEYAVMVKGDAPWQSWDELVEHVQANPREVSFGTDGAGSTNHLTMVRIGNELGLDWNHVPFKGGTDAAAALLGGHVDVVNNTTAAVASAIESGDIRPLLVTSQERLDIAPDVPTMEEEGFDFAQISYMSIIGPNGIPQNRRKAIEEAFAAAAQDEEVRAELAKMNLNPRYMPGEEYQELLGTMSENWGALLKELNMTSDQ